MTNPITVIITDDKEFFRNAIRESLKDYDINVIAECNNGIELLKVLETKTPDVILLDLKMPEMDGNQTLERLCELKLEKKVLMVSFHDDPLIVSDFLNRGAGGYICKDDAIYIDELVSAIQIVKKGRRYKNFVQNHSQPKLSIIQKEIIILISEHKPIKIIAQELGITPNAIGKQLKKIRAILGVESQSELNNMIFERGLKYLGKPKK